MFGGLKAWLSARKQNYELMREYLHKEAIRFEAMTYEELQQPAEELTVRRTVNGHTLYFSAEAFAQKKNGDLAVCIDADGLPTILLKPSYRFFKRRDGSVYH